MGKTTLKLVIILLLACTGIPMGCDGEGVSLKRGPIQLAPGDRNVTFDCDKLSKISCESGYEYCLRSTISLEKNWYMTGNCIPKPENCNDCDCSKEDVKVYSAMMKNCKGDIYCRNDRSKIVVTCIVPPGATDRTEKPSRAIVEKPTKNP